ncbi:MAG: hypothetical protein OXG44_17170 [Gammaproteobacteria bacterium]|nr:hypothetical protein [Gammaproteobacteria bacterium]
MVEAGRAALCAMAHGITTIEEGNRERGQDGGGEEWMNCRSQDLIGQRCRLTDARQAETESSAGAGLRAFL